jgi:phosphoribosyl-dephospho-CoA transferase
MAGRVTSIHAFRPHYLLEIVGSRLIESREGSSIPEWVGEHLRATPFVVVRRGLVHEGCIPIGVRGEKRNQRWAAYCKPGVVKNIITPSQLLGRTLPVARLDATPALRALKFLESRWMNIEHPWGPGGSVGFELATGGPAAKADSDLDIVMYVESHMPSDEAKTLCAAAMHLPAAVDIHVETPVCGFSLWEYARESPAAILLRTQAGAILGRDPWRAGRM